MLVVVASAVVAGQVARVDVRLDTAEADAVLAIVASERAGKQPVAADWLTLTSTPGYQRLKARERAIGAPFEDDDFKKFVESSDLAGRADAQRRTLEAWAHADVTAAANRALAYLPADATIQATVFLVVKPKTNSFVFEPASNPAIFLYVDPAKTTAQVENTMAHELHHIGAASLESKYETSIASLSPEARTVARWMGAFAEGLAMLAAAGGADVHPHAMSPQADRERWDRDVANFSADLRTVEQFFLDVLDRRLTGDDIQRTAMTFYGVQGPWYTVGWKMATVVEHQLGRREVIQAAVDPRTLLINYNRAVRAGGLDLPLWSDRLMTAVAR